MGRLFQRAARLNVGGKLIQELSLEFRIDRNLKVTSNTAEVTVYNLAPENRKYLQTQKGGVMVELRAGYSNNDPLPLLFLGQLREVTSVRDGADWLTQISSGDGDKEKKHPVAFSLGPGASFEASVRKVVNEMGLKVADGAVLKGAKFGDGSTSLSDGYTAYGQAGEELDALLKSGGLEHSIQNGQLQITKIGAAINKTAVTLDQDSGLIGSPELGDAGSIKYRSLLNAEIFPGRLVHVKSENVDGFFRTERAVYSGQTFGGDWYVDVEGKVVKTGK